MSRRMKNKQLCHGKRFSEGMNMEIDKLSETPIYLQIYNNIADEIINGYLIPKEKLMPRRVLCEQLGVAQRTVENAYQKLVSDGYVIARQGSGYYVSDERVWDDEHKVMKSNVYNFSSNGVETSKLPFDIWSKLLRSTVKENSDLFQHGEKAGEWCLRKSIRRMLFRTQGIQCRTDQIIIGPGGEDLLREIVSLLAHDSRFLMNNYYNYRVYNVVKDVGIEMEYITNGADGIDTEELKKYNKGILYQKPTHDLPTAVTLSEDKRAEIVGWLGDGKYVIEDSDENCYQYGENAKTLWEMSGGKNVIYLGSFSKTIAPSMKIGYIVAPDEIVKLWFEKKQFYSNRVSRLEQVTLSRFIDLGYYEKHIGYMRDIYREKTQALKKAVEGTLLGEKSVITGDDAGMFCLMHTDIDMNEDKWNSFLNEKGVKLSLLTSSIYDRSRERFEPNTHVVGYGDMTISQIRDGIARWNEIMEKNQ
jgi:GntR family transcriptional regulator/MocR family aminotransferase